MAPSASLVEFDVVKSKVSAAPLEGLEDHDLVLRTFRVLIADLVQQYNGGHPG
jgi:dihydroxyacetone synthase